MKKNLLILTAALMLLVSGACAESIFPVLTPTPTAAPAAAPEAPKAPSYGMMANTAADEIIANAQGDTVVTYRRVAAKGFNDFGIYLGNRGFQVIGSEARDGQTAYSVSDGQTAFVLFYDPAGQVMTLVYPRGTAYEQPRFPGYQPLSFGEEVLVPGVGRLTADWFSLNKKRNMVGMVDKYAGLKSYCDINGRMMFESDVKAVYTFLGFRFFNITDHSLGFSANQNDLCTMTLHYANEYGEYSYEQSTPAACTKSGLFVNGWKSAYDGYYVMASPLQSLTDAYRYAIFDVPSGVRESADGTLYVTIEFTAGDRYVLLLRDNGVNLYE